MTSGPSQKFTFTAKISAPEGKQRNLKKFLILFLKQDLVVLMVNKLFHFNYF
jgi:hypothetical protein